MTAAGAEVLALGTSIGQVYLVNKKFEHEIAFTTKDFSPITAMTFDERTKMLVCGTSTGYLIHFSVDSSSTITAQSSITSENEIPVTSLGTLNRGINLCVATFANGQVKLSTFAGELLAEFTAHS